MKFRAKGRVINPDIGSLIFYDKGDAVRFRGGSFVPQDIIERWNISDRHFIGGKSTKYEQALKRIKAEYFVHPDSLRIRGAFDFAHKKKGKFTVGVIRTHYGRGDVLMASVIAKALKHKYKDDVEVWFAVMPQHKAILSHIPYIDRSFTSEKALLDARPDVHVNVNDMEFRVENKEFETQKKVTKNRASIYLEGLGLELENKTPSYIVTPDEKRWAIEELKSKKLRKGNNKLIGVQLYGSNPSRTYPHMNKLVVELIKKGYEIIKLDKKVGSGYEYTFRQVAALIEQCDVIVSSNTMGYHLAGALRKRAVAIFGSVDGKIWVEDYEKVSAVQIKCPLGEPKCWWKLNCLPGDFDAKQRKTPACLRKVPIELVQKEIENHFMAKRILVVVLTYNFLKLTQRMIDSIRSFHNYDILVIDNKSTDGTVEWLKKQKVECVSKPLSVPQAWNLGMKEAYNRGYDYCLLCNNDILLSPSYIDAVVEVAERRKAYAVTGNVIEKGTISPSRFAEEIRSIEKSIDTMVAGDYSALLISRGCVEKVGKFNESFKPRYQSDEDHLLRLRLAGQSVIKSYATTFYHLLGAVVKASPQATTQHEKEWAKNVELFKKLWHVDPYKERNKLASLNSMKKKNPGWEKRIRISFEGLKK